MANKICQYCGSPYISSKPNSKYCPGKLCASRMGAIKKKLKQKEFHNTLEPRICKRCGTSFHFHSMKKMCQECVKFLKEKPSHYKKEPTMKESNICIRCKKREKHSKNPNAKYCLECRDIILKEKIKLQNDRRVKSDEELKIINEKNKKEKKSGINPYFLKRNTK